MKQVLSFYNCASSDWWLWNVFTGLRRLVHLGCQVTEKYGPGKNLVEIELPEGWSSDAELSAALSNPKLPLNFREIIIYDQHRCPRIKLTTESLTPNQTDEIKIWRIDLFTRLTVTFGTKNNQARIIDLARSGEVIREFSYPGGRNQSTALDWLTINYPDWRNPFAYREE
ncbi:hypothetical protein KKF05_04125 [Patescibacteria group bacterium]|nr:hypothetical protein [Patescibacteria group bacterium]MBU1916454.1 hypothetical protein [Patescibacteria group bacterium]